MAKSLNKNYFNLLSKQKFLFLVEQNKSGLKDKNVT